MASLTIEPVLLPQQWKKNGTNFFRLRLTLNRKSLYTKTNILVRKEDLRGGKIINPDVRHKVEDIVRETEKAVSQIDTFALDNMTLGDVLAFIENIQKGEFRLDFFKFGYGLVEKKAASSRAGYTSALNSFKEFVGCDTLDIGRITSSLLRQYEQWLRDKYGDSARAVTAYTAALRFVHAQARARYNNEETGYVPIKNPFQFYKPPVQRPAKHRAVEPSVIAKMLELRESLSGRERLGVDVFLLSFALMGMNCPDMYGCSAPKKGVITYNRAKTRSRRADHAEMKVKIDPLVERLVDEYAGTDRAFSFAEKYTTYQILGENVNDGLRKFCKRIKTDPFTLYSARHAWASIAYKSGIDKGVINDCLCHVDRDMKVTDIYIDKDWSVMWKANHKVLSRFRWPQ